MYNLFRYAASPVISITRRLTKPSRPPSLVLERGLVQGWAVDLRLRGFRVYGLGLGVALEV